VHSAQKFLVRKRSSRGKDIYDEKKKRRRKRKKKVAFDVER
jgi:hypothetical protein